ncbi:alpha-N-arabinofuranosidase [Paenibacillus sp. MSJ-34]|uniref:alpha-N-arabinofuranosidase n=1 Tax=Paenibacillus sp. MSJ-34 TaxID=2841529 RepID=UPI001C11D648|nr:alpha-L-arabinofuranosidase C-terminal domain-containing protein [Paenibacillus sp. MSJ-34]MBU5441233.1 hypothetical protein [Paenibacillus sp. MSJ-34]
MVTTVEVKALRKLGEISPNIYGQYFEHLEDCIYPSILDENSPLSDHNGFRKDVLQAAKELGAPIVRWPGGCFADLYHWEDGIGPREKRPLRRNWHWGGHEPNRFGTDEFLEWCRLAGTEPYINFNMGTGTLDEALRWMDYCNGQEPTADVLSRRRNGRQEPYNVKYWGIGNETWGFWEAGQMDADAYARKLANWCEFVRKEQADARILAVGSNDASDPDWDRTVLEHAGKYIDYLTLHTYACSVDRVSGGEYYAVAFTADYMESRMRKMLKAIDLMADRPQQRPIRISVDEWNIRHCVWNEERNGYDLIRKSPRNTQDAVFAAGVLNAMIRLSPRIGMANYVFIVNGNGVMNVNADTVVKTPLYYLFQQYARWMRGEALEVTVDSPRTKAPKPQIQFPHVQVPDEEEGRDVSFVDAAAAMTEEGIAVSLVNRHQTEEMKVRLVLPEGSRIAEAWTLHHEDLYAVNDFDSPNRIVPVTERLEEGTLEWTCPAHSVVLLSCKRG